MEKVPLCSWEFHFSHIYSRVKRQINSYTILSGSWIPFPHSREIKNKWSCLPHIYITNLWHCHLNITVADASLPVLQIKLAYCLTYSYMWDFISANKAILVIFWVYDHWISKNYSSQALCCQQLPNYTANKRNITESTCLIVFFTLLICRNNCYGATGESLKTRCNTLGAS